MQRPEFDQLLDKYKEGKCTPDELAFIENWYLNYEETHRKDISLYDREEDLDDIWGNLSKLLYKKQRFPWPRIMAAASVLLFLCLGGYYLVHEQHSRPDITKNKKYDIAPGGNKAILTLANGRQILLTNAPNGKITNQGNAVISKTATGQIVYTPITANAEPVPEEVFYNTISTPKGGQYLVVLPDGSKVMLNAASSLRYPIAFTGKERKVELTGEAYFEVIHHAESPFRVTTAGQVVEDIGTQFNISAYNDDDLIKTTLTEGSIKVSAKDQQVILKPGQQSAINISSAQQNIKVIESANVEEAIAWKNGYFRFNNKKIPEIMRQLSRWYNVDVKYKGNITDDGLNGKISRFKNINQVLQMLESTRLVHFKVQGKEVTVIE